MAYGWLQAPVLDGDPIERDERSAGLAALVNERRRNTEPAALGADHKPGVPLYSGKPFADLEPGTQESLRRYTKRAVAKIVNPLDECRTKAVATWPSPAYTGRPWDTTTFAVACALLDLAESAWCPLTVTGAVALLVKHAPTAEGFTLTEVKAKYVSALARESVGEGRVWPLGHNGSEPPTAAEVLGLAHRRELASTSAASPAGPGGPSRPAGDSADSADGALEPRVRLTPASAFTPRRVHWLWHNRIALGLLSLLSGPEGLGKSTLACWVAAQVTLGLLPGEHLGTPRGVLLAASEDSWQDTIVPRLIAAGADLDKVYRGEVIVDESVHGTLTLPRDVEELRVAAAEVDASLPLLDPLMSAISARLDTHRDREVRLALDPIATLAEDTHLAVIALIHHNKSGSSDPLRVIQASTAFTATARSVHTVLRDPDDEDERRRLFGTVKNNLGTLEQPTLSFTVQGYAVPTSDGDAWTGQLVWGEEFTGTIRDALDRARESGDDRSSIDEATDWLLRVGGEAPRVDVLKAARPAGHADRTVYRARKRLKVESISSGQHGPATWRLPAHLMGGKADD